MKDFEKQRGIAFFLIFFSHADLFYYLPFRELMNFWKRMEEGGRKSFRREELNSSYYLTEKNGFPVPYLDGIQTGSEITGLTTLFRISTIIFLFFHSSMVAR